MKKSYMFFILIAAGLMLNTFSAVAQEAKLTKEEKKAKKKADLEYNYKMLDSLLTTKKFIMVGEFQISGNGERTTLNEAMSFLIVNDPNGKIYMGSNYNNTGIPREGTLGVYKLTKSEKNLSMTLQYDLNTPLGRFDVLMDVLATNLIRTTISGQSFPTVVWEGHIETLQRYKLLRAVN